MPEVSPLKLPNEGRWAIACYVPIFNIVACVLAAVRLSGSEMVMLHARQGMVLFAMWFLTILIALVAPLLSLLLWLVVLGFHGFGMFLAIMKKNTPLPFVGKLAIMVPKYFFYELLTGKTVDQK